MKIKTRGFKNKLLINYIRKASNFFAREVLPEKNVEELDVKIFLKNDIDADGLCLKEGRHSYLIELRKNLSFELMMITLAHEFVHVKQYDTNELKSWIIKGKDTDVWRGRRFRNLDYEKQPWELEANQLEEVLYQDFIVHCLISDFELFEDINKLEKLRVSNR